MEEEFIKKETIRTMKKDIAQLQGEPVAEAVIPEPKVTELAIEEEAAAAKAMAAKEEERKRAEIERKKTEEAAFAEAMAAKEEKRKEEERKIEEEKEEEKKEAEEEERRKVAAAEAMAAREEEEKNRREEEERRKKEEPEIRKKALLEEKEKIEEEKTKIAESFKELAEKKKPLEAEKATILGKLKEVKENFQIIAAQEREIEEKQRLIEEKEEAVKTPSQKKQIEKERWKIEEKRQELEKERWPWDEKINQLNNQIKKVDTKNREIEVKEGELIKKQKEFFEREEKIQLELEKIELKEELQKLEEIEESFETKKAGFSIELDKVEESLEEVSSRERKIEEEKKLIEEEERATKELRERRKLEKERWEIGEKRRKIETERWELEEKKHKIEIQLKRIEGGIQTISEKRNNIIGRIKEIDQGVRIRKKEEEIPEEKVVREEAVEAVEAVEEVEEVEEAVEEEKLEKKIEEEPEALAAKKIAEGEVEKRRIEEVKKRIEALKREEETRKREELLARLQRPLEEKKPPVVLPKAPSEFIRIVPKPPSFREKLWVRIFLVSLILVLLFGIGTFWYWFFIARKQPPLITKCQSDTDCPTGQICGPEGNCLTAPPIARCTKDADCPTGQICESTKGICLKEEPGITIPPSLFSVDNTRNLTISVSEELRPLLSQTLQEWQGEGQFTRLIIKNTEENKILGLKEFLEALLVRAPEELYQKLENGFNLFIYSQSEGNRLGFVTKIKNYEGLANLLRNQETTMESDFETFFTLMGKEGSAVVPYFRSAINVPGYAGPNFRYQTITRQDLGISYLTSGDYFVFTGSWKSMERIIEKLKITGIRIELTTDLKRGDKGYEVELLQTWLSQEPAVYPQAIINGIFGPLTELAVIRFQEKYAPEILAPQGLSKGNGIVNSYTRIKLNELYGDSGIKPRMTELTTDLRIGDDGEEVKLLQSWLAKDRNIYPQGITSGYFGYLTQQAVIHFQQKYSSEILTPQGLSRGTGIVDALTRKRLNELYGQ